MNTKNNQFLPQDGRYDDLRVYQKAECICDITDYFCKHFLDGRKDRTVDQMVQAARSGKQNIVEGTAASATSKETEIKLLNIAIILICQEDLMLRNLIEYHKQEFLQNGGIREEMTRGRIAYRSSHPEDNRKPVSSNTRLSIKEQELNEREKRITQKELELARKEEELRIREKEIARLIRMGGDRNDGE